MKKELLLCSLFAFCLIVLIPIMAGSQPVANNATQFGFGKVDEMAVKGVIASVKWSEDGNNLYFSNLNNKYRFDLTKGDLDTIGELTEEEIKKVREERMWWRRKRESKDPRIKYPSRGRQFMVEKSPDEKWYAICDNWNVILENIETQDTIKVTTTGHRKFRYGTANWVYGEEINVKHGMWFTKDSKKLIYFVFDERPVKDFYLVGGWSEIITTNLVEGYTKAGDPNPIVSLEIYDLDTKSKIPVDCGKGEYIYNMRFTPDEKELLFNRTDRHQRHLDVVALDVNSGKTRIVVSETQEKWQDNSPVMEFLKDGKRFIWETEKTGFRHYELRDLGGKLIATLTKGDYPALKIIKVDEEDNWFYYTANSDKEHPLCAHLHRVQLDGNGHQQLTSPPLNHRNIKISPEGKWFTVQYENLATPPSTALYKTDGKQVKVLAQGPEFKNNRSELFTFKAGDGVTDLYGVLHKPEDFDSNKKYPLIVSVYGGPESRAVRERFRRGHMYNSHGYLVTQIDNRGTSGRGKAFKDAVYGKLGDVDIQDQAEGVKYLRQRPSVDGTRVGITGHSYGGYMAAIAMLKHPDVFTASVALASVTWYRNYDSIWTERYLSIPQDNEQGYENGNCMNYVKNLKGHLLIMHGLADDNVHPNNVFQLTEALNEAGKHAHYETRFFPNAGHVYFGREFQKAFFDRYLRP